MFRTWIGALAVALIAVTTAPIVVHIEHGADRDCEVCELINESLANLSDEQLQVRPTDAPQALVKAPGVMVVLSYHGAWTPARAPPTSVFPLL